MGVTSKFPLVGHVDGISAYDDDDDDDDQSLKLAMRQPWV